jgi:hypothetical protein
MPRVVVRIGVSTLTTARICPLVATTCSRALSKYAKGICVYLQGSCDGELEFRVDSFILGSSRFGRCCQRVPSREETRGQLYNVSQ